MASDPTQPTVAKKLPAWAISILKWFVVLITGGAMYAGGEFVATKPVEPTPAEIEIDAEFYGEPGDLIALTCKTAGARVKWRAVTDGLNLLDDLPDLIARKEARAIACAPGRYEFEVWSAISGEPTSIYRRVVVVGKPGPGPNPPTPVPPTPVPPTPVPPVPEPTSELAKKLQACWAADPTSMVVKTSQRALIVGLYEAMVEHAKNEKVATTGDLLGDLKVQAAAMLLPTALTECRKIISAEVAAALGTDPATVLDATVRGKAVDVFGRIAKAMAEVK